MRGTRNVKKSTKKQGNRKKTNISGGAKTASVREFQANIPDAPKRGFDKKERERLREKSKEGRKASLEGRRRRRAIPDDYYGGELNRGGRSKTSADC